uniref:Uncharacterized protein n=1 Tax=Musa acuminata TaxID=4641 RepID=Q1EPI4_MUSAC|nr:hypothetical protein MA4_106O17.8 [Musa acuminata]
MAVSEVRFMDGATESWELPAEMDSARVQLGSPPSGNRAAAFEVGGQVISAPTRAMQHRYEQSGRRWPIPLDGLIEQLAIADQYCCEYLLSDEHEGVRGGSVKWLVAMTNLSITADGDSKVQEADQICRSQERQQIASGDSKCVIHATLADASPVRTGSSIHDMLADASSPLPPFSLVGGATISKKIATLADASSPSIIVGRWSHQLVRKQEPYRPSMICWLMLLHPPTHHSFLLVGGSSTFFVLLFITFL